MMELQVNGHTTYCYTGGKSFDAAKPTVVFIHGVFNDHSVWILQTATWPTTAGMCWLWICQATAAARAKPRHRGRSCSLCRCAAGCSRCEACRLVGHSWGSLIALEAAAN
jgi:pimeloyl-ACP methyl ester carboxylesterase